MDYPKKLAELASARADRERAADERKALIEEFSKRPDVQLADQKANEAQAIVDALTDEIKAAAVEAYNASQDKNKKPLDVVQIKVFKVPEYDQDKALEWAKKDLPSALRLDRSTFEKAIEIGLVPKTLATIKDDPRAQIASDLSAYLSEEGQHEADPHP